MNHFLSFYTLFLGCKIITAATIADIVGGKDALQCYTAGTAVRCRDLNAVRDWKVFERAASTTQGWTGGINAGGTKLVCEDGQRNCVINLDGSYKQYVSGLETSNGRFWRDSLGNDWVVYSGEPDWYWVVVKAGQTVEQRVWMAGTVWKVKIDSLSNTAIDSTRTLCAGEQYSCGMNGTGAYAGDAFPNAFLYNLNTGVKSPVLYDTTSWWSPLCFFGSIHPGGKPWLMYSLDTAMHTVVISQWNETANTARTVWQYHYASGKAWAQWSTTDESVCAIVKNRKLYITGISPETSGSADNTGSFIEASAGISFASDTDGVVGGPWLGSLSPRAGTPRISPDGGFMAQDSVTVSMTSVTDSAALYYSVDGSVPDTASSLYSAPFSVPLPSSGSITVSARAFKSGMPASPAASVVFTRLALEDSVEAENLENGLRYEYYEGYFLFPGDINEPWAEPCTRGDIDSFTLTMREREDRFGVRLSGYFRAAVDGKYTFHVTSDDSSEAYIDGKAVVYANYKQGTQSGFAGLKTGLHAVTVLFHQGEGGKELKVEYEGPGVSRRVIPSTVLFRARREITITRPAAFDTLNPGSSIAVKWQADESVESVRLDVSVNPPSEWMPLTTEILTREDQAWGSYSWSIPGEISDIPLHDTRLAFRVRSASDTDINDETDHTLYIFDPSSARSMFSRPNTLLNLRATPAGLRILIPYEGLHTTELVTARGRLAARHQGIGRENILFEKELLTPGMYLLRCISSRGILCRKVLIAP